ncbi:Serine/threonine-protein phosphatase 2A 56 kDa regulatory subunit alpha isoform [Characodon lateralis]|uniref:Serine/threonine-protein phosphatase 2A 56 kDa regulatory subunit alpha isoform n=1 Tax=Characodon lateralis TaxID=208331 RepID=A0ABU7D9X0_9TELE|nr:Serine/threonine-protein phosphatase 2A 56 kDa regulatory subunit alpha isoform [Characodon lateralis]
MSAISASEKVDGFTRKSVRKAQKQRRSQGSSQFRTQSAPVELSPLPQLKGFLPRLPCIYLHPSSHEV